MDLFGAALHRMELSEGVRYALQMEGITFNEAIMIQDLTAQGKMDEIKERFPTYWTWLDKLRGDRSDQSLV